MSINNVGGALQWKNQEAASASTHAKGRADDDAGTATAAGGPGAFQQSLPADLQSLLPPGTLASTPADPTSQTASTKLSGTAHHQHHLQHKGGGSDKFTQSASAFAADVTQAMQAYRLKTLPNPNASTLA